MSTSNKPLRSLAERVCKLGALPFGLIVAGVSLTVWANLTQDDPKPGQTPTDKASQQAKGAFQIRCWQYGQLLFEEYAQSMPTDLGRNALGLHGKNDSQPLLLVDTQNATCLVKATAGEHAKGTVKP
jgi:hypothetical protein